MRFLFLTIFVMAIQGYNIEHCKEFQCTDATWYIKKSCSYCCKDCCLITISSSEDCTQPNCESQCGATKEGHQSGVGASECSIYYAIAENGNKVRKSKGCESGQFCTETHGGKKVCKQQFNNTAPCTFSNQCMSDKCTKYKTIQNICYGCIPDISKSSNTYGRERSEHCFQYEYCDISQLTCKMKLHQNSKKCAQNDYMCNTGLCSHNARDSDYDTCIACQEDQDCSQGSICRQQTCVLNKLPDGSSCSVDFQCISNKCSEKKCRGSQDDGTKCHTDYQCRGNSCKSFKCQGTPESELTDIVVIQPQKQQIVVPQEHPFVPSLPIQKPKKKQKQIKPQKKKDLPLQKPNQISQPKNEPIQIKGTQKPNQQVKPIIKIEQQPIILPTPISPNKSVKNEQQNIPSTPKSVPQTDHEMLWYLITKYQFEMYALVLCVLVILGIVRFRRKRNKYQVLDHMNQESDQDHQQQLQI